MTPTSTSTVVAVFDDYATAESASRELTSEGIPQSAIQIQSNLKTSSASNYGTTEPQAGEHEGGFMGWWNRTFGTGEENASPSATNAYYDNESGHYAESVRRGSTVVAVTAAPAILDRAVEILNSAGAVDVDRRVSSYRSEGYKGYDPSAPAYDQDQAVAERARFGNGSQGTAIPVVEEELQVGKRSVQRGGVRVYSRLVEQPVEEQVNLREEHVRVERRPVNRLVNNADLANMRDQSIEVTEMAEEAVVSKQARVREEVVIGKETTERTENIRENVRHTEVHVDQLDADKSGYDTQYFTKLQSDPRFAGRPWSEVENDVRADYTKTHPSGGWDALKERVREGWASVTGSR